MMVKNEEDDDNEKKRKQSHTDWILLIAIDLSQANYQTLLITYQKSAIKNANHAWKRKKLGWNVNLLNLKMADWIANAKNVEKNAKS